MLLEHPEFDTTLTLVSVVCCCDEESFLSFDLIPNKIQLGIFTRKVDNNTDATSRHNEYAFNRTRAKFNNYLG